MLIAALVACAISCAQAEPIKLEYKYTEGEVDKYKVVTEMNVQPLSTTGADVAPMNVTVRMTALQKTIDVLPDGSAVVDVTVKDAQMSGTTSSKAAGPEKTIRMTVSKQGQFLNVEGAESMTGNSGNMGMDFSRIFGQAGQNVFLPVEPVEVGASWQSSVPIPFGGGNISLSSSLTSAGDQMWGQSTARIKQDFIGTMDLGQIIRAIAGRMQGNDAKMLESISGSANLKGSTEFCFAPMLGKLLTANGTTNAIINIDMPAGAGQNKSVRMNIDMKTSTTRFK
jgi:hypothetical protein